MNSILVPIVVLATLVRGELQAREAPTTTPTHGHAIGTGEDLGIDMLDTTRVLVEYERLLVELEVEPRRAPTDAESRLLFRLGERAAELRDPRALPPLHRVVLALSESSDRFVAFQALDAMWRLGEKREYFERAIEQNLERPWQAIFCMRILGRVPDQAQCQRFLEIATRMTEDRLPLSGKFADAATNARAVIWFDGEFRKLQSHPERVRYLLPIAFQGFYAMMGITSLDSYLEPKAAWARHELERLSILAPHDVVDALLEPGVGEVEHKDGYTPEELARAAARWERLVLSCLGTAARDLWKERKHTRETSGR